MALPVVTPENYYSPEMNMAYMGSTQFKAFERCEAAALAELKGEYRPPSSVALLVGGYIDAWFSGELPLYQAQHPEIFKRDGTLKAEYGLDGNTLLGQAYSGEVRESEAIRIVRETLQVNPYITNVTQVSVSFEGSVLHLSFKLTTIYGEVTIDDCDIAL